MYVFVAKTGVAMTFKVLSGGVHPPQERLPARLQDLVRTSTTNCYHGNWPVLQREYMKCLCGIECELKLSFKMFIAAAQ